MLHSVEFKGNIEILSTSSLLRCKFAVVSRKSATFCRPSTFTPTTLTVNFVWSSSLKFSKKVYHQDTKKCRDK